MQTYTFISAILFLFFSVIWRSDDPINGFLKLLMFGMAIAGFIIGINNF